MKTAYIIFQFVFIFEIYRNTFYIRQYLNQIFENYLTVTFTCLNLKTQ